MKKLLLLYLVTFGFIEQAAAQSLQSEVSGAGPKIILIPGLASSGDVWDETVSQLSQSFECHVLTLPGFAENPAMDLRDGFLPKVAQLVSEYISQQKEPVLLIGHSLGGFLSLKLAKANPEQVKKVVIVDSFPFYSAALNPNATAEGMIGMAQQMKEMMIGLSEDQFKTQQQGNVGMMTIRSEKSPEIINWSLESDRTTVAQAMYELMTTDYREELTEINTPILVLGAWAAGKNYGLTEESVRATFANQYGLAPDVRIEMAPSAHHFIMWDNPEWFMNQVSSFLQ